MQITTEECVCVPHSFATGPISLALSAGFAGLEARCAVVQTYPNRLQHCWYYCCTEGSWCFIFPLSYAICPKSDLAVLKHFNTFKTGIRYVPNHFSISYLLVDTASSLSSWPKYSRLQLHFSLDLNKILF